MSSGFSEAQSEVSDFLQPLCCIGSGTFASDSEWGAIEIFSRADWPTRPYVIAEKQTRRGPGWIREMSEFWVSQGRVFCEFCKCWYADNKVEKETHERWNLEKVTQNREELDKASSQKRIFSINLFRTLGVRIINTKLNAYLTSFFLYLIQDIHSS